MSTGRILTIVLIAGSVLYGQRPNRRNTAPPTPAQLAQRETNRLTRFFTLDTAQQSAVLGILTTAETQLQALTPQIQPLRTTLMAAIKSSNSQGVIGSTLLQISNLEEQEQVIRANAASQIYTTVLNATQQGQVGNGLGPLMNGGPGAGPGFGGRGPGGLGPARANRN
jgi:hypothetical protein